MNTHKIILGVVIVLLLYLVYVYFFSSSSTSTLVSNHDATQQLSVSASSLPSGSTANYTYSIWFYINEWNYRYGEKKVVFQRLDQNKDPAPEVYLDPTTNNLHVSLATYPSTPLKPNAEFASLDVAQQKAVSNKFRGQLEEGASEGRQPTFQQMEQQLSSDMSAYEARVNLCSIEGVPLQRWTNLIMTLNNRALDLYLDGKLVRTCVLPGVPKMNPASKVTICPNGGFSGYISNFQYISNAINPTQAYNIYKAGYGGGSSVGNFFDKYRVKVAFVENNKEVNSFEL